MFLCGVVLTALVNMQKLLEDFFPVLLLLGEFIYPVVAIAGSFSDARVGSPTGIFQAFGTKLGLLKHPSLCTEQLMDFMPLQYEA